MLQRFKKILEARHSHLSFFRGKTGWLRSSSQTIYGSTCLECFADSGIAWQPRFLLNEENIRGVAATLTQARMALSKEEGRLETVMGDKALQETQERVNDLTAMVQELQDSHKGLVEELRCKVAALDIDNSCRRVTPQAAAEPPQQKTLQQSASAPNFRKGEAVEDQEPDA
eukprot:s470_g21.t1